MSQLEVEARSMFFAPDAVAAVESREKLLQGKVILVTGASRGIGAEIARTLGREGAIIVGPHRDPGKQKRADDVAAEVNSSGGEMVAPICDITSPDDRQKLFDEVQQKYGRIDIFIHNAAGGMEKDTPPDYALKVNYKAKLALNALFVLIMPKGSKVIDITSLWSLKYGRVEQLPKYEPVARTKNLAEIFLRQDIPSLEKRGITLGFVCGHVVEDTITVKGFKREDPEKMEAVLKLAKGGKPTTTVDMANAVLKLATTNFPQGHIEYVGGKNAGPENWDRSFIRRVLRMYGEDKIYVDNFLLSEDRERGIGTLYVTERHCAGHFGILPGHILEEAAAQTLGLMAMADKKENGFYPLLTKRSANFLNPVFAGDVVQMKATVEDQNKRGFRGRVSVKRQGENVAEISVGCPIIPKDVFQKLIDRARKGREVALKEQNQ